MYETDQEQIEALKGWWVQYGNWVISGVIVFFAAYVGVNWYQHSTQQHRIAGSQVYEELLAVLVNETLDSVSRQALTSQLKTDFDDLGYGVLGALFEAKAAVEAEDYDAALAELNWAEEHADDELMNVVLFRTAQVHYQINQLDKAISTLRRMTGEGHQAVSQELMGDIFLELGRKEDAREAYLTALNLAEAQGINNPYLKIKSDQLAAVE